MDSSAQDPSPSHRSFIFRLRASLFDRSFLVHVLHRRLWFNQVPWTVVGGVPAPYLPGWVALNVGALAFHALDKFHLLLTTACVLDELGIAHLRTSWMTSQMGTKY